MNLMDLRAVVLSACYFHFFIENFSLLKVLNFHVHICIDCFDTIG